MKLYRQCDTKYKAKILDKESWLLECAVSPNCVTFVNLYHFTGPYNSH